MIIFSQCDRFVVLLNLNSCLFVRGCICVYLCMQPVAACCSMLLCVSAWASALQSWSVFKRAAAVSSASTFTTNHTSITQHTATLQHTCCKVAVCCSVSPLSAACRPSSHILHWLGYMIYEYRYKTSTSTYHHTQSIEIDVHHMSMDYQTQYNRMSIMPRVEENMAAKQFDWQNINQHFRPNHGSPRWVGPTIYF